MTQTVLLVGASGFVGAHCLQAVRAAGYDVYPTYHNRPPPVNDASWRALDIFDDDAVSQLMSDLQPKYLINCAWYVAHGLFWDAPINAEYVRATIHLYKSFSAAGGMRALFLGTGAESVSNDASKGGDTAYARAKRETAALLNKERDEGAGASYLWARLFALYGAGEPLQRFAPYVLTCYLAGGVPTVQNPHLHYNFTYAANLARMLTDQLQSALEGDVACATGDTLSLAEMAAYIHEQFFPDSPPPLIESKDAAPMVFAPVDTDRRVDFHHLNLLSRYDALKEYMTTLKDSGYGM